MFFWWNSEDFFGFMGFEVRFDHDVFVDVMMSFDWRLARKTMVDDDQCNQQTYHGQRAIPTKLSFAPGMREDLVPQDPLAGHHGSFSCLFYWLVVGPLLDSIIYGWYMVSI